MTPTASKTHSADRARSPIRYNRQTVVRAAILVLAVTACSNLPPYEPVCGNGVIEPHEDCDSTTACFQCSQPCDASAACPAGLACGGDRLCHAPGGQFRGQGQVLPFDGQDLFVADVDGDRIGDLVEISATSLTTLHSQLGVGPVTETVLETPFVTGPAAIGSFDAADQTQDVVLPTDRGIAAYTSTQHVLSPYPFALDVSLPDDTVTARPYLVFPLDAGHLGMVTKLTHQDAMGTVLRELDYVTIDISGGRPSFSPKAPICGALDPDSVQDVVARPIDATHEMVAITGGTEGCVLRVDAFALALQVELPGTTDRLAFASLANAPCPSVLAGQSSFGAAGGFPACSIATTAAPLVQLAGQLAPGDVMIGSVPLAPALAGYGSEAIATTHGIFAVSATAAAAIYRSDRALTRVQALDFDGDGDQDLVAIADGADDLDVLFRFEPTYTSTPPPEYQLVRYDTVAQPHLMLPGDFDGNQIPDLAYSERTTYGERFLVMFGTQDRPTAPVEMATFRDLIALLPGAVDPSDPSQTLQDLSVLDYDDVASRPLLTLMHCSPQRVLFPSFQPNLGAAAAGLSPPFTGVAVGHFGGTGGVADLFSVAKTGPAVKAWLSKATDGAFPIVSGGPTVDVTCTSGAESLLCTDSIHFLTWAIDASHDTLIAVDDEHRHANTFDPAAPAQAVSDDTLFALVPAGLVVHSLQRIDLDGDGAPELVASFGADPRLRHPSVAGIVLACHVDAAGVLVAGSCVDLSLGIDDAEGVATCVDAAVGHVTSFQLATEAAAPPPGLLLLCHRILANSSDVFRVDGAHLTRLLRISSESVERIFLGDLTGDAVDDLIALDVAPGALVPTLTIYGQCTSRDTDQACAVQP